ncbi:hypothetical protein [Caballeronia humi]|uniref:Uncharacterized protein n=1 Tax=Caballeronia humi TaxID=326474 RepID=A0A158ITA1_9BURK|nr:hypothetical protein [Caballeronia humi]SAL59788.1 hypothetical protein AWB65_05373 [Caballeronia humi]
MRIIDLIHHLLPAGTDAAYLVEAPTKEALNRPGGIRATYPSYTLCPIWPPDLFAVTGLIIDLSGCYTEASPDRAALRQHEVYIEDVRVIATSWESMLSPPKEVEALWRELVSFHGQVAISDICRNKSAVATLLKLFAIADEASMGMGWDASASGEALTEFASIVMLNSLHGAEPPFKLPYWPTSLAGMVSPDVVIVLPKAITTTKGCTIRSLSHHLALLPCRSTIEPSWSLVSRDRSDATDIRLLLIPFPFEVSDNCFRLSVPKTKLANGTSFAAFFELEQKWLTDVDGRISGKQLAKDLVLPLVEQAKAKAGGVVPHGIVLPECALSADVAKELVEAIASTGVEFVTTGVLDFDSNSRRWLNQAKTFAYVGSLGAVELTQNKHHRWRIDKVQATQYGLDFDPDPSNDQWWEDIGVTHRTLPFYAIRADMTMVTLICEDLARMDPAMNAIRAVGPNLVIALLMDGPQSAKRWPGRYAGVLADEPGCAVLTLTCAAMMDRSNRGWTGDVHRTVALGSQADGRKEEIELSENATGMLLVVTSQSKHQTTLDNRSDWALSRELKFKSAISLSVTPALAQPPRAR